MNMSGMLVHKISDRQYSNEIGRNWFITYLTAYKLRQTYLMELEKRKHIRDHCTEFRRNFVRMYDNSSAFTRQ